MPNLRSNGRGLSIAGTVPWGRTADDYISMFQLSSSELKLKILGCGDGPYGFHAEMTTEEINYISVEPIYDRKRETPRFFHRGTSGKKSLGSTSHNSTG